MPDHLIRLRGAWKWLGRVEGIEATRRVTLPTLWPNDLETPCQLVRPFGRPAIDPRIERLWLDLQDVPGLTEIRLNGVEMTRPADGRIALVEPLLDRNELVLDIDLRGIERSEAEGLWGSIALIVASRDEVRG